MGLFEDSVGIFVFAIIAAILGLFLTSFFSALSTTPNSGQAVAVGEQALSAFNLFVDLVFVVGGILGSLTLIKIILDALGQSDVGF